MINIVHHNADQLFEQVSHLIAEARSHVARAVNSAMVTTYYEIGRHIVENEQNGQQRAQYGKQVLQDQIKLPHRCQYLCPAVHALLA